ncbi:hypothetical protein, partial [Campylobacter fetus]|uniref:hypothetical protein n=1 Tax=Campylobacter fetus TaxID=196 RepID=UPI0011C7EC4A
MADIFVRIKAQNDLSPELKQSAQDASNLSVKISELEAGIKQLKADKKGILSGAIISDIPYVKELQREMAQLAVGSLEYKKVRDKLNSAIQTSINLKQKSLTPLKEELNLQKELIKVTVAEEKAKLSSAKTGQKANAVRRETINTIVRKLRQLGTLTAAFYSLSNAYTKTIGKGIELNRQIESQSLGIAALITANTKLANGVDNSAKRFKIAMTMSDEIVKKLRKASIDTAATFPELTAVFQQAIGGALGAGKAMGDTLDKQVNNTIKLAQRMTNIAASIGMPMVQVNEEIRSLVEGTTDINSRISKMLGITNEQINAAKQSAEGLVGFLDRILKPFDNMASIMTFDKALARVKDTLQSQLIDGTSAAFTQLKENLIDTDKWLKQNKDGLQETISIIINGLLSAVRLFATFLMDVIKITQTWKNELITLVEIFISFKISGWIYTGITALVSAFAMLNKTLKETAALSLLVKNIWVGAAAAIMYGGFELYIYYDKLNEKAKELNKTLALTTEEIKKQTAAELENSEALIKSHIAALKKQKALLEIAITQQKTYGTYTGGYDDDLEELVIKLKAVEAQQSKIFAQKENINNAEKTAAKYLKKQAEERENELQALGKLSKDTQKAISEAKQAEEMGYANSSIEEKIFKHKKSLAEQNQILLDNNYLPDDAEYQQYVKGIETTIKHINNLKQELNEKQAKETQKAINQANRDAKKVRDEAEKAAKEKLDATLEYYEITDDYANISYMKLKEYEVKLLEQAKKGYITKEQLAVSLASKKKKIEEEISQKEFKDLEVKIDKNIEYYKLIGDKEKLAIEIKEKYAKKAEALIKERGIIDQKQQEQVRKSYTKIANDELEKMQKIFDGIRDSWNEMISSMAKNIEDGLFDFITGKTTSLKSAFRELGKEMFASFISPYARSFSSSAAGLFTGLLGGGNGGVASFANSYGLELKNGVYSGDIKGSRVEILSDGTVKSGGNVLGEILSVGSSVTSIANLANGSTLSGLSGLFNGGAGLSLGGLQSSLVGSLY